MFTFGNLVSTMLIFPIVFLFEWNFFLSLRKTLFICAYGMIRDLQSEYERFYLLNPYHISTLSKL